MAGLASAGVRKARGAKGEKRVRDLPDWPPLGFQVGVSSRHPTHPGQVSIKGVKNVSKNNITVICFFESGDYELIWSVPNRKIAKALAEILSRRKGDCLFDIRDESLPDL
jgi:hypothetical protein